MKEQRMARSLVGKGSLATKLVLTLVAACMAISLGWLVGCSSGEKQQEGSGQSTEDISVYSREDGSGTRGAFIELFGLEEKDDQDNKVDTTTDAAAITNSTSVMMASVKGDPGAIGYISLGSLDDSVKSLKIDGVEATADNVKDGSYKIARPFNIVTTDELTPAAQDFITFIMSKEGQTIVEDNGYIAVSEDAASYTPTGTSEKIVVAGSSSVTPVMEKLAEAYKQANPEATIEVQQSDSTTGVTMAVEGTCDIGMASRELKDSEMGKGAQSQAIARDGIAVIVPVESAIEGLTSDQVKQIFSGKITSWGDVK